MEEGIWGACVKRGADFALTLIARLGSSPLWRPAWLPCTSGAPAIARLQSQRPAWNGVQVFRSPVSINCHDTPTDPAGQPALLVRSFLVLRARPWCFQRLMHLSLCIVILSTYESVLLRLARFHTSFGLFVFGAISFMRGSSALLTEGKFRASRSKRSTALVGRLMIGAHVWKGGAWSVYRGRTASSTPVYYELP